MPPQCLNVFICVMSTVHVPRVPNQRRPCYRMAMNRISDSRQIKRTALYTVYGYEWLKVLSHGQICIHVRVQIFAYMQILSRVQICPCERICTRMQNFHHMQILEICTWLRPNANFNLHIRKFCIYANLSMWTEIKICVHEYLFICALLTLKSCCFNIVFRLSLYDFSTFDIFLHNIWHF